VGFIVEGVCEFQSFECFIRKGVAAVYGRLPIVNAWGNGGVRKRLEEHLVQVVRASHPVVVIVALDMRDALEEGAYASCAELRADLQVRADAWLAGIDASSVLRPLPQRIVVVVQAPLFEGWLTADPAGLHGHTGKRSVLHHYENVDESIRSPGTWLNDRLPNGFTKSPILVLAIAKALHPARMAIRSRSFRKFWKEVVQAFRDWETVTGNTFVVQEP
jgi:hypothetical protein